MTKAAITIGIAVLGMLISGAAAQAQTVTTILAIQDFEDTPATPTWTFTGTPSALLSGFSSASATPASSPVGIGGSQAWHVVSVSSGNPLVFTNQSIPPGYDRVIARFRLAAMNLNGSTGGPDNLDYVLVEYSLDNGATFVGRLRVRGAVNNDCSWAYDATGLASVPYLPATEEVFQPINSGLQTEFGYSTVEIVFPGTITQLTLRITPRSSSSSDSWLVDNLLLVGEQDVPVELMSFDIF